jgi:hypothetical protein
MSWSRCRGVAARLAWFLTITPYPTLPSANSPLLPLPLPHLPRSSVSPSLRPPHPSYRLADMTETKQKLPGRLIKKTQQGHHNDKDVAPPPSRLPSRGTHPGQRGKPTEVGPPHALDSRLPLCRTLSNMISAFLSRLRRHGPSYQYDSAFHVVSAIQRKR